VPAAAAATARPPAATDEAVPAQTANTVSPTAVTTVIADAVPPATHALPPAAVAATPQPEPARVALAVAPLAPATPPVALELVSSVEPVLPDRVRRRMRRDGEVTLAFKVNPDGSVADLNVQASSDSALDAIALDAVRQWRYKPIAEARTHRLQLVFRHE
jgi:protein TonB